MSDYISTTEFIIGKLKDVDEEGLVKLLKFMTPPGPNICSDEYQWAGCYMPKQLKLMCHWIRSKKRSGALVSPMMHPASGYGINSKILDHYGSNTTIRWDINHKYQEEGVDIITTEGCEKYYASLPKDGLVILEWPEDNTVKAFVPGMLDAIQPRYILVHLVACAFEVNDCQSQDELREAFMKYSIVMKKESLEYIRENYEDVTPPEWLSDLQKGEPVLHPGGSPVTRDGSMYEGVFVFERKGDYPSSFKYHVGQTLKFKESFMGHRNFRVKGRERKGKKIQYTIIAEGGKYDYEYVFSEKKIQKRCSI